RARRADRSRCARPPALLSGAGERVRALAPRRSALTAVGAAVDRRSAERAASCRPVDDLAGGGVALRPGDAQRTRAAGAGLRRAHQAGAVRMVPADREPDRAVTRAPDSALLHSAGGAGRREPGLLTCRVPAPLRRPRDRRVRPVREPAARLAEASPTPGRA